MGRIDDFLSIKDFREILGVEKRSKESERINSSLSLMNKDDELTRKKFPREIEHSDGGTYTKKIWHYRLRGKKTGQKREEGEKRRKEESESVSEKEPERTKWPLQDLDTRKRKIINILRESRKPLALRDFTQMAGVDSGSKEQSRISSTLTSLLNENELTRRKLPREIEGTDGKTHTVKVWHYQLDREDADEIEEEKEEKKEISSKKDRKKPRWPLRDMDVRKENIIGILKEMDKPLSIRDFREIVGVQKGSKRSKKINSAVYSLYNHDNVLERKKLPKEIENGSGGTSTRDIWHFKLKRDIDGTKSDKKKRTKKTGRNNSTITGGKKGRKEYYEELGIKPKKVREAEKENKKVGIVQGDEEKEEKKRKRKKKELEKYRENFTF